MNHFSGSAGRAIAADFLAKANFDYTRDKVTASIMRGARRTMISGLQNRELLLRFQLVSEDRGKRRFQYLLGHGIQSFRTQLGHHSRD
jgi:hypothetical protein